MPLVDTHAHLHFPGFAEDRDAVLARARAAGVRAMVTIGTDRDTNPAAVALAERHPEIYATVGIHPHAAGAAPEAEFPALEGLPAGPRQPRRRPLPRCPRGDAPDPGRGASGRDRRRDALLLGRRGGRHALSRPRAPDLAGGPRALKERAGAPGGRPLRAGGPAGGGDRLR